MHMKGGNGQMHLAVCPRSLTLGGPSPSSPAAGGSSRERPLTRLAATGDVWAGHAGGGSPGAQQQGMG